jgi:hypothetical protein
MSLKAEVAYLQMVIREMDEDIRKRESRLDHDWLTAQQNPASPVPGLPLASMVSSPTAAALTTPRRLHADDSCTPPTDRRS